ncbi:hypothetical protein [Ferrimonas sp. SCSIO 43195]|uniref:hypothetical protein n=1 Tax=Ferrimonas sp. SCSIO 43195 TaxID=2822844 RepID=UPI0020759890|nr:hypothetical protein [Ferrimonas sp. SCSIO 43195]USD36186.1 hypothetical protein J8Z22_14215 [Ferrimonas sp. SCSIO 43195]
MRTATKCILLLSLTTIIGALVVLFDPVAHEHWNPVRTSNLANESIEDLSQLKRKDLAGIVINVSEYNMNYIDGATMRIHWLKCSLFIATGMLSIMIVMLGITLYRKRT